MLAFFVVGARSGDRAPGRVVGARSPDRAPGL